MTIKPLNRACSPLFRPVLPLRFVPSVAGSAAALLLCFALPTHAQTWVPGAGGSWNSAGNWSPATIPNTIGASVIFNSPTAARTVTTDSGSAGFTVGSISSDIGGSFGNTFSTGTSGSKLILNNGGAGVTITTSGAGGGNNTFSVALVLNDNVTANVNQTTSTSGAGSLNLTGTMSGSGGFTKQGDGLATFGTAAKTYTGPTVLNGGRMRISNASQPSQTSSFTINAGGQLDLISAGTFGFGSGPLNLNGSGPTTGPYASFPGAIRNDTGIAATIVNSVVLQSDTLIHVQGTAASTTFSSIVSGVGKLTLTAAAHDANLGVLGLNNANTYSGGTVINGGALLLSGPSATLGLGDVTVKSANLAFVGSTAKLSIQAGVLNAIADTATLSLAGGGTAGVADDGFADLGAGINETIGSLFLGGLMEGPGTYGSSASGALYQFDEYFSGTGTITVIPEPGTTLLLCAGGLLGYRRSRRGRRC